jgi:poly-gamma-glutamate synthase PgsB/CapB
MELWALLPIGVFLLGKIIEERLHRTSLSRTPLRIHVNGTRGKSQTTELIVKGIQAAGIRAMGKVTGVVPLLIHVDGSKTLIKRIAPPSIREQKWTVRQAAREEAEILVIECMAIKPELQWVSERKMIRSQIGVITNVRLDHTDLLGRSPSKIARALANTIPKKGVLFTTEQSQYEILSVEAKRRETKPIYVDKESQVDATLEKHIPPWIHPENLALALVVCEYIGIPRQVALRGMIELPREVGSFEIIHFVVEGKRLIFVNAFAANDPQSTQTLLERALLCLGKNMSIIGLFNHRRDRFFRARTFADFVQKAGFDQVFLIGDRLPRSRSFFPGAVDLSQIHQAEPLCTRIASELPEGSALFGFGNIGGIGIELSEYLKQIGEEG